MTEVFEEERFEDEKPSKSQRKREQKDLQSGVLRLAESSPADWTRFELSEALLKSLAIIRKLKPSGARNREVKYASHLLAQEDFAAVRAWFEGEDERHLAEVRKHKVLENWRDRLLEEGDGALTALLEAYPSLDRDVAQTLRQWLRLRVKAQGDAKRSELGRKIFRLLRDNID